MSQPTLTYCGAMHASMRASWLRAPTRSTEVAVLRQPLHIAVIVNLPDVLLKLAKALDVKMEFFFRPASTTVVLSEPTGSNTTEVIVDSGPPGFSLGSTNVPYVTVKVCRLAP